MMCLRGCGVRRRRYKGEDAFLPGFRRGKRKGRGAQRQRQFFTRGALTRKKGRLRSRPTECEA